VIVADGLEMTQYVRDARIPAVAELHDSLSLLMTRSADREDRFVRRVLVRAESLGLARWERQLRRRFALVVTNSEVDAEEIRRLDPLSPVKAIGNGVDTDYFHPDPSIEVESTRVVFTGGDGLRAQRGRRTAFQRRDPSARSCARTACRVLGGRALTDSAR
jgi:glycosyltransferase involved in cell wall biosynthesis